MGQDVFFPHRRLQTQMLRPYDVTNNSKGRELINRVLMLHFASFFCDGDRVLYVGKQVIWDYSVFFNGPHKQVEFVTSDIEPAMEPDVVDNICDSQFETDSFDGVILIGIFDSLKGEGHSSKKVISETHRILKPGGRLFAAIDGKPNGSYDPASAWPDFYVDEVYYIWGKTHKMEEGVGWYGMGPNQVIILIMRNRL